MKRMTYICSQKNLWNNNMSTTLLIAVEKSLKKINKKNLTNSI